MRALPGVSRLRCLVRRGVAGGALAVALCAAGALGPHASAAEPPSYTIEGGRLLLPGPVVFETGKADIKPESEPVLRFIAGYLAEKTSVSILRIEGHTESASEVNTQQALSERRALAVTRWLVAHGTDCKRLLPVGFGASKPVDTNETPEGRARNRRIEAVNAALRGRPIGGMPVDGGGKVAGDPCAR